MDMSRDRRRKRESTLAIFGRAIFGSSVQKYVWDVFIPVTRISKEWGKTAEKVRCAKIRIIINIGVMVL